MISQYIVKYYRNMKAWHGLFSTHCKQESSHVVFSELDLSMVLNTLSTERIFLSQDQGIPEAAKNKFIFFQCLFFHRFRVTFMLSPVNSIHVFQSNQISVCILYNQGSFTFFFIIPRTCNRELVQYILNWLVERRSIFIAPWRTWRFHYGLDTLCCLILAFVFQF